MIDLTEKLQDNIINEEKSDKEFENLLNLNNVSSKFIIPRNIDKEKEILISMGFDTNVINKIFLFLQPSSFEKALSLILKENGLIGHNFFPNPNKQSNLCFICGQKQSFHKDGKNINDIISIDNQENKNKPSEFSIMEIICEICEEKLTEQEIKDNSFPCGHCICKQCFNEYIKYSIKGFEWSAILCPHYGCKELLNNDYILNQISTDSDLLNKYKKYQYNMNIQNNPNQKFCPFPNCDGYLLKEKGNKFTQCQYGHKYCFICLSEWHTNSNCKEIIDKDFQLLTKNKILKRCPKCKFYIEKTEGCNHIICRNCEFQFCWLCLQECKSSEHFNVGSCKGLYFSEKNNFEKPIITPDEDNNNDNNNNVIQNVNQMPINNRPINNKKSQSKMSVGMCYYFLSRLVYSCLLFLDGGDDDEDHLLGSLSLCFPCIIMFNAWVKSKNCFINCLYELLVSLIAILMNIIYLNLHLFIIIFYSILIVLARIMRCNTN